MIDGGSPRIRAPPKRRYTTGSAALTEQDDPDAIHWSTLHIDAATRDRARSIESAAAAAAERQRRSSAEENLLRWMDREELERLAAGESTRRPLEGVDDEAPFEKRPVAAAAVAIAPTATKRPSTDVLTEVLPDNALRDTVDARATAGKPPRPKPPPPSSKAKKKPPPPPPKKNHYHHHKRADDEAPTSGNGTKNSTVVVAEERKEVGPSPSSSARAAVRPDSARRARLMEERLQAMCPAETLPGYKTPRPASRESGVDEEKRPRETAASEEEEEEAGGGGGGGGEKDGGGGDKGPEDDSPLCRPSRRPQIRGVRVAALVEGFESLAASAELEAARLAALMRERDPAKVRAALEARRRRALEEEVRGRQSALRSGFERCAKVTFANVSAEPGVIVVQLECATEGATVSYAVVESSSSSSSKTTTTTTSLMDARAQAENRPGSWRATTRANKHAEWVVLDAPMKKTLKNSSGNLVASSYSTARRVTITTPGRHVMLARASKPGLADSTLTSTVWWLARPASLQHEAHPHSLMWRRGPPQDDARCAVCACRIGDAACYGCADECSCFVLCFSCAFGTTNNKNKNNAETGADAPPLSPHATCDPAVLAAPGGTNPAATWVPDLAPPAALARRRPPAAPPMGDPPGASPGTPKRPARSVALDPGGKRIWLSEPIEFDGNRATIKLRSFAMLSLLAGTLKRNGGLCIRLEGHTNSNCGLECHGKEPCHNNTCTHEFFGRGGAMGFSLDRASAVRDWLLSPFGGNLGADAADRIVSAGFGGSRRLVEDTEGRDNYLNRRVEAHIVES